MAGVTRADVESLNQFLSARDDGAERLAYRRDPEQRLRRCVLIGTSHRARPLPNDENLRRFVPINLDGGDPAKLRRSCWTTSVTSSGPRRWPCTGAATRPACPKALKVLQAEATGGARSKDTLMEDAVEAWIVGRDGFTMAEIAAGIGLVDGVGVATRVHMRDQWRIGAALDRLGYTQQRRRAQGGRRVQVWVLDEGESGHP